MVGTQEFQVPDEVLGLIYAQTVVWVGSFFCPLLPLLNTAKFLLLFYLKKVRGGEHRSGAGGIGAWASGRWGMRRLRGVTRGPLGRRILKVSDYWILKEEGFGGQTPGYIRRSLGYPTFRSEGRGDGTLGSDGGKGLGLLDPKKGARTHG